jgi:hypothetical protein
MIKKNRGFNEKIAILNWLVITCKFDNSGNKHDHNELTGIDNLSFLFFFPRSFYGWALTRLELVSSSNKEWRWNLKNK